MENRGGLKKTVGKWEETGGKREGTGGRLEENKETGRKLGENWRIFVKETGGKLAASTQLNKRNLDHCSCYLFSSP